MAITQITELPPAPSRQNDGETFATRADAFVAALQAFREEANAQANAVDALVSAAQDAGLADAADNAQSAQNSAASASSSASQTSIDSAQAAEDREDAEAAADAAASSQSAAASSASAAAGSASTAQTAESGSVAAAASASADAALAEQYSDETRGRRRIVTVSNGLHEITDDESATHYRVTANDLGQINLNSSVALGVTVHAQLRGSGRVAFFAPGGTLRSRGGNRHITVPDGQISALKTGASEWSLSGDLDAVAEDQREYRTAAGVAYELANGNTYTVTRIVPA